MYLLNNIRNLINRFSRKPNHFISTNDQRNNGQTLTIQHKLRLNAKEIASNESNIQSAINKIIETKNTNREYAGKQEENIKLSKGKIYKYESYQTQNIKLAPNKEDNLDVYVEDIFLGKVSNEKNKEIMRYLPSTIFTAFAYITGGPFKHYLAEKETIDKGFDPFNLTICLQFS